MMTLETKNRELEELNKRDTMTLLYNHASILSLIDEQVRLSKLDHSPMAMLIMDLDDFKVVNDTYGHQKGDEVLLAMADILRQNTRSHDLVGRYGGEEFFVLFPKTCHEDAHRVSERIRQKIAETDFDGVHVTVSGGLSIYTGEDVDAFIRLTDDRLYQAKATGKNRIVTEDPKPV